LCEGIIVGAIKGVDDEISVGIGVEIGEGLFDV